MICNITQITYLWKTIMLEIFLITSYTTRPYFSMTDAMDILLGNLAPNMKS
jgi:hypothetical protein